MLSPQQRPRRTAFALAKRIPCAAALFDKEVVEHPQHCQMLLDGCVRHPKVGLSFDRGRLYQIAKVRAHSFLSNLVCLFSNRAKEAQISLQVAAVGIQCVEGKTSARLEAKPARASPWLPTDGTRSHRISLTSWFDFILFSVALRCVDGASQRSWAPTAISSLHPRRRAPAIGEWSRRKTRWKSGSQFHITVRCMISSPFC
jgi:hypothetical protein